VCARIVATRLRHTREIGALPRLCVEPLDAHRARFVFLAAARFAGEVLLAVPDVETA